MKVQFSFMCKDTAVIHVVFKAQAILVTQVLEDMIHEFLHDCWAICWSKRHNCGGVQSLRCFEGQYVLGFFFDGDIIVPLPEVELAE